MNHSSEVKSLKDKNSEVAKPDIAAAILHFLLGQEPSDYASSFGKHNVNQLLAVE